jgi:hypothetical protein
VTAVREVCRDCRRTMGREDRPPVGVVRYGAHGRCLRCDQQLVRKLASRHPADEAQTISGLVRARPDDAWPGRP